MIKKTLALVTVLVAAAAHAMEIHVAKNGRPGAAGTVQDPLTFEAAIERASAYLKKHGAPEGGLTMIVAGGRYHFERPFVLGPEFAGTPERPIVIRAADRAEVWFDGSPQIDPATFSPVTDPGERSRLAASAADKVRVATVTHPALIEMLSRKLILPLLYDGRVYLPAVFPNRGYAKLKSTPVAPEVCPPGVPIGKQAYGIRAGHPPHQEPGKPQGWKGSLAEPRGAQVGIADKANEMAGAWEQWERELKRNNRRNQLVGYIEANWLLSSQPICAADAKKKCLHLSRALAYGWAWRKNDKPFRVFGLLCELDAPGEWHFDVLTNRLYLYPPTPMTEQTDISLPVAKGFLSLEGASYVSVIGLSVQNVASGSVYRIARGHHNLIAACTIRTCTATGLDIHGTHNAAKGCDLIDLDRHVALAGGVRSPTEITSGHNLVENCHIYQKQFRHQKVNISMRGVGNCFRHNLVHNSIGQAMTVQGNDQAIEFNEFFNIGFEEGDGGAVYSGADLTGYGNVYRYNFFHHLMHVPGKVERSGIHLDDYQAGATCIGNIFYKSAGKGVFMNGGAGHTLRENVFLEGYRGVYNVGAGARRSYERQEAIFRDPNHMYRNTKENYVGRAEAIVGKQGWTKPPWRDKYPLFFQVMSDTGPHGRFWPIRCRIENNLFYGNAKGDRTLWSRVSPQARAKSIIKRDRRIWPEDFVDYDNLDLRFKEGRTDLPHLPFEKIGLRVDEFRSEMPDKRHYRMVVKAFFHGIPCMPGARKKIDTAAVVENGPKITRTTLPAAKRAAEAPGSLLRNGGFETGQGDLPTAWTTLAWKSQDAIFRWEKSGGINNSRCISIEAPRPNDARFEQVVQLEPHTAYALRGYIKAQNVNVGKDAWVGANLSIYGIYRCASDPKTSRGTFDWRRFEVDFATGPDGKAKVAARLGHWNSTVTGKVFFDNLTLKKNAAVRRRATKHFVMNLWVDDLSFIEPSKYEQWLGHLDAAYEAMNDLVGRAPWNGAKIGIYAPTWYPGGWAVAGNPIRWRKRYVRRVLEAANRNDEWGFGVLHEIGHDFDQGAAWNFNGEFWANFKLHYAVETLNATMSGPEGLTRGRGFRLFWKRKFEEHWVRKRNAHHDGLQHKMLLLQDQIGWEPFKRTFRSFWAMPNEDRPKSKWAKFQRFHDLLAQHSGCDVWSIYTSEERARLKAQYPDKQ